MAKISIERLMAKMSDPGTRDEELSRYFIVDGAVSGPFDPQFRLNPATVEIPEGPEGRARTAQAMNLANWWCRMSRRTAFYGKLNNGYDGPVIVSEGDSWFQYPLLLDDTIDVLMRDYAILSLGAAGDLLGRMAQKAEFLPALRETGARILLLSGGGNDLVAGGALAQHLEQFHPDLTAADYLLPSFQALLDDALAHYGRMFTAVRNEFPHVTILCHGYDYPVPDNDRWLGKPMQARGIRSRALQKQIAAEMMDRFNRRLRRLADTMPHVTYIDCRGVVGDDRWHDGLHPTNAGYADVASKFAREIRSLDDWQPAPTRPVNGPFGNDHQLIRAMPAPAIAGGRGRGMSLHVGLNSVDPAHYAGWDGALKACEADALAMQNLAAGQGFETDLLLTPNATREAVVEGIRKAAADLKAGDMFLLTVSAHGGRIPDFNRDEDHDGDEMMDETLCLYDFQLADDELYMLWTEFVPGVRVLMVPDTCHSGSMVRMGPVMPARLFGRELSHAGPAVRAMPLHVENRVWRANEDAYRNASRSYEAIRESVMLNPLSSPVRASVLNLGAAKDTQFAMDGPENGAFTGALLQVWDEGRFDGDYATFRDRIEVEIGSASQTPVLFDKLHKTPEFTHDRPFTIAPGARPASAASPSHHDLRSAPAPDADEGEETDTLPDDQVQAIAEAKARGAGFRDAQAALSWPDYAEFDAFIRSLGLRNFATDEFLVLGGSHNGSGPCAGKNTYPPKSLWPNIARTARALDLFRDRIGKPIVITNAYRAPAYNACIGGATSSQHMAFRALDFKVIGMSQPEAAMALRWMRDRDRAFTGGIGRYNGFTHIDTRPHDATWPPAFKSAPLPDQPPLAAAIPRTADERMAALSAMDLAEPRGARAKVSSSMSRAVPRGPGDFDPSDEIAAHQGGLKAAVDASSVISFVENLTAGQKEDVLLSTLFAQRAADARHDPIAEREAWYARYTEVLSVMGWTRESAPFEASQKMKGNGSFDKVILSTLAAVATGNQLKIVESAIEALRGLADDTGQIKLFDLETSTTEGGNFQIGSAEAAGDVIALALGAFNFRFKDKKSNILFVSWGKNELDYWISAQKLALSPAIYADVREVVKMRLAETRKSAIFDIDIG
ncbi:MAG: D-Ala-D-Ala carboxypeptidase family metallohydrolase [Pseudooceanicola sp.]